MPTVVAEFEVWCADCGDGLCGLLSPRSGRVNEFEAIPCPHCLKNAQDEREEELRDTHEDEVQQLDTQIGELEAEVESLRQQLREALEQIELLRGLDG